MQTKHGLTWNLEGNILALKRRAVISQLPGREENLKRGKTEAMWLEMKLGGQG